MKASELGVETKMVTGDHVAIGKDTARRLGMGTNIMRTHIFQKVNTFGSAEREQFGGGVHTVRKELLEIVTCFQF